MILKYNSIVFIFFVRMFFDHCKFIFFGMQARSDIKWLVLPILQTRLPVNGNKLLYIDIPDIKGRTIRKENEIIAALFDTKTSHLNFELN